ncbi:MAG: hypothetical protein Q8R07_02165, partial [Candidatus Uhrbacteria bacterium]|nr:hypothetical protein [Candidatus Uhrbacteria bacterium]
HAAMAGWTIRLEGAADNERVLLQPGASCEVDRGEVQLNCWVVRLLKEPPALVPTPATAPSPHGQDHTKIEPDELALHPLARWIFRSLLRLLDRNP